MQIGLVGLQYSGKTTLLNTVAGKDMPENVSVSEDAVIEVVKVPDDRLDKMSEIFNPKKQVNATIEIFDFPGLRTGDDGKIKITTNFLSSVKNNDALIFVVRQFKEDSVMHPMGEINPRKDIEFLETEFLFSDLSFFEKRLEKIKKDINKVQSDNLKKELPVAEKCYAHLEEEKPLRTLNLDEDEIKLFSGYQLLTLKPLIIALNLDEEALLNSDAVVEDLRTKLADKNTTIIPFSAKIEYELSLLSEEDREVFMNDYGIKESSLSKLLNASYKVLGLQSFLTVGEDECRAWTIKKGYTAQQAAGVIHSDFYNRFIRAEVVFYEDFLLHGSFAKCKEAGVWRLEGKDYIVKDGDILNIRHN